MTFFKVTNTLKDLELIKVLLIKLCNKKKETNGKIEEPEFLDFLT